jgi:amino acid adenylation domain-containing protein
MTEELPLSYSQQRLWFLDQFEPNSPLYNIPLALRLVGTLNIIALEQSLQKIVARHEALRTNFITVDGEPTQIIHSEINCKLSVVNLKDLSPSEQEIAAEKLIQQQATQPFDLANQSLIRSSIVLLSETEQLLLICMHHIVSDGWSMGVFVQELSALYNAYNQDQPSPLTPLPVQYADYAIWQREWLQGEVRESQLSYWQQQLADAPSLLSLPTDRPRSAIQTFNGTHQEFALSPKLTEKLTQLSREQGVTLFMTLLAAFNILLYRYTGESDILVGSPIANRNESEIEGLIGFFVNTLVLRTDLSGNPSFRELLIRVRETTLGAYDRQDLPFEMLVEALQPERNLSYTPLFQVMFALQNNPLSSIELAGLEVSPIKLKSTIAKFDLTLGMETRSSGLVGVWSYNTDLFDGSTIERMTGHFVTLLEGIVADPQERISQLPLLTEVERQQLLIEWNQTQADYPSDKCIHQLFESQVKRTPNAIAVVFENEQLTYSELNNRANQLANYLQSFGVGADVLVGICVERSIEMVIGLLGILKAGGAYVPLDPEYPQERLSFMLEDTQVKVLLTQKRILSQLPQHQAEIVCLDDDWSIISQSSSDNLTTNVKSSNLAYVIYTSGSTGQPKGVMIEHQGLLNLIFWHQNAFEITSKDKATQLAGTAFDAAVWELWPYLTVGASVHLVKSEILLSPVNLQDWLQSKEITISFVPTPVAEQLLSLEWTENTTLRTILTGGDKLNQYPSSLVPFQLVNNYGPTESTVVTTSGIVVSEPQNNYASPSIGRPIANTQVYILDRYLQPVPVSVPGELHIGGASLARGYLNRLDLTQQKFISNPFGNSKLYKTGDLVRYLPDGNIEYLGRIDNQVKIRGFRIELGEIETIISQYDEVKSSVVIVREDIPGDKRLVAYIVPQSERTLTISNLRQYLKAKLPEYMVPAAFVMLESLPLTPNGKVDRRALPAPDFHSGQKDKYIAPRSAIEEILTQIWSQILKVEQIGINDNFFELGGHSLLATQLVSRIRQILQVELPLRELFANPTIGELAQSISHLQQSSKFTAPPILPRTENAVLPLSFAQQRLWFLDQFEPNSALYNIPLALRLAGTLNQVALEQSFQEIIARHEALRTNFITVDGQATQVVHPAVNWQITVVNLQDLPTTEKEITSEKLVEQQAVQPFDLTTEVLIRATLVVLSETEQLLLVCMHHVVSDGWSIGIFIEELTTLYNAYSQGESSPLTPLSIQYPDFALWQREWLQGEVLQEQLNYWEQQLADAPALLSLPTDRPRPAVQTFAGAHLEFTLDLELSQKLMQLSREQGVTLFMTLLAAYNTLLYRYTGQEDILVGTPIANRNRNEIEGLIGFFVNTLVLRTDLSGNPSFNELLMRVRNMAMDAYAHQDLPFEMLVEALQPERDLSHAPLFQVDFLLQNEHKSQVELNGLTVSSLPIENSIAKFDLTLAMENRSTGLVGVWEYNTDLFERTTIDRIAGNFITLLEAIVANPKEQISQLPLLTEVQRRQLLVEWNDTDADYPQNLCLNQLFEEQVKLNPDAIAVAFNNQELTYQELNTQANQLAHHLQSIGVKPESLVGIYLERSLSMIVALLAVLKAGGAYVPLDPDYPIQRLAYIAEDSQLSVLITQQTLLNSLPIQGGNLVVLDAENQGLAREIPENTIVGAGLVDNLGHSEIKFEQNPPVQPENLACLLYTSGSTGKPKGVMLTHEALVNHSSAISEVFGLTSSDRVLQFASLGFDVAAEEIFPTWLKGATVVLRPVQMFSDLASFANFIDQEKLSVLNITPAYWHEWVVAVSKSDATVPPSLRLVAVGGDAVLPETVILWKQLVGNRVNCLNVYGPTEASVTAVVHDLLLPSEHINNSVLIGRPIANTQIYILDRHLQPVPIGVIGELHIGGIRLARGYLNRPELTAEKFLSNPFKDGTKYRIYKTGDLARYLPDGTIECLGRIDNQVKIRGFRIELGEIEAVLNRSPLVEVSCIIVREDTPGDKRLVAYVVPQERLHTPKISELRQFLSNHLPLYMVPSAFVFLESLPLTTNRKVDRRALPTPDIQHDQRDKYVAPRTPVEEMLAQIWAQVLKIEQVGIYDNFFELGGHSLLATQLVSRIRNTFKVELPLRSLFAAATVSELAHLIGQLQPEDLELKIPPILPRAKDAELSLSYAQNRLWFLEQLQPNSATYNIPLPLRLVGNLKVAALEQSLQEIIVRHEALRTNFITVNGQPKQVINIEKTWILSIVDLKQLSPREQEITCQELAKEQAIQPFNLATDSLIRATLIGLSETEYFLLICMHHIVSDDWSMGVFLEELAALYNAYAQGQHSPLNPLPIQYADFALWQRNWLQEEVLQSQFSYWQQQLADAPALLSLPTDRPRPAVQTFNGGHHEFSLSVELSKSLTGLSQQQGVTLFMTLLAAFDTLLYRYTGQSDILVGTPIANRNHSEIEGLIGFFVNALVMRTDLSENPSFAELLTRVRETALGAYTHQDLPFEMLVEALQPERDLSHTPLFQVAFVLQNAPFSQVELSELTISDLPIESPIAKFDITLAMGNTANGLVGVWEYNTDLFDASTIARLANHFVTLLEGIVANPQERISQLPLLTEVERQQLLIEWNQTQADYPSDKCIHQLFEEQVKRTPDAIAVVFENQQLTYQQLNAQANQLAHYLKSLGVEADTLVGLCVERSLEMIVGLLGILKAGGAYLPLDPGYPTERLHFMLEDAQVSVLLTQQQLVNTLPEHNTQVVCLDSDWSVISQSSQENLTTNIEASNLAYVIYTSGSTGKPKGVLVNHSHVVRLFAATNNWYHFNAQDVWTLFHSIAFDFSVWEIWGALLYGGRLVVVPYLVTRSPESFYQLLLSEKVTVLNQTPSAFRQLIQAEESIPNVADLKLRLAIFGGETLELKSLQPWFERHGDQTPQLVNMYGITETTVHVTYRPLSLDDLDGTASAIGRPIPDLQVYLLDEHLQPVPIGVKGEMYVGGAGVTRGYLNREELTAQRFISSPFDNSSHQGDRGQGLSDREEECPQPLTATPQPKVLKLYKTGDLARYLPSGELEYLGRIDNQVKVRGFRIELGEIEALLASHPDVWESVVVVREDVPGDQRLVAYVVFKGEISAETIELRQFLANQLPAYMVPNAIVVLKSLPLTSNGKVDRRALRAPDFNSQPTDKYVAPRNSIEEILAQIWIQILKLEQVGIYDNFFEIGGHSLLATQVISRVQEAFNISLPLRYLFELPTIAQLSQAISDQLQTNLNLAVPPIVSVSRNGDIPLSWAQERLWFVNQLEGESAAYTIDFTIRLVGNLNVKALEQAFREIVQRHEPLRTRFVIKDSKPIQAIAPTTTLTLPVIDLQNLPEPWKQVETQATEEACKPFDLTNGPVLRVKLWQVAQDDYVLVFAIHHIAADGWSMGVLIGEISAYYRAIVTGNPVELSPLPIQYADFAVWQRKWLTDRVLQQQLNYWKQQLTGAPPLLELPTDRPRPAIQSFRGGTEKLQLDIKLTQELKKLSQKSGTTLFMTLLAGFVVLASRYSGQTDIVIGSPIANRNRTEIEGLIGFFVNTLALRFDLSEEPSFESFLAQVKQTTQDAYENQDLPFEMLVEELQIERHLDRNPLTQVVFALQNAPSSPWDLPGVRVEGMPSGLDSVRVDLEVYLWDAPEGLSGFCSYNKDLFDETTIARMMQHFQTLLTAIVENPQQPVALLPILTPQERYQLLEEWNDTQVEDPQDKCIHQLFESQVKRTPNAIAVVFENEQLTYAELNNRANQLAHYLRSLGVGADVLVGLCVERSLLMPIGLLAILKAGGAYVPLDPEYPQERLSFMLEDSQVSLLLTQQRVIDKLPQHQANIVFLDSLEIAQQSQDNLIGVVQASNLAYVIYTSGSTGKPKGVMVEHKGLYNLAIAQIQAFGVNSKSRVLQFASFSFDACISEILMTFGSGATLYLGSKDSIMPGMPLIERLRNDRITHITLPPSALAVLPTEELPTLSTIIVAGEACSLELIKQWSKGRNFYNGYGPTEASVCTTIAKCVPEDEKVSIGRPIANTQVYILDSHLQPVPIGVPGELHISGVGLARGYLNRMQLTTEKFIPNPFENAVGAGLADNSVITAIELKQNPPLQAEKITTKSASATPNSKLYKTGDKARYLPDGKIEYLGRIDNQVKIRGFRIELGEIEAVLSQHPLIQTSAVVVREDIPGDKRLVAYLVPDLDRQTVPQQITQWQSEYVSDWQTLYEQSYSQQAKMAIDDPTFNISGWNSSYTKQPIPAQEMRVWVESTVNRILSVSPQRVLEIGCGSGLLLYRVAKNVQEYWGTDYSLSAVEYVERVCRTVAGLNNVYLRQQTADNFADIPKGKFDTVVLNSVVQYFPSVDYLLQVLEGAVTTISDRGTIFIGDVRSLPLLEPYHAAVQLSQATDDRSIEQWQQQVNQSITAEEELVIDPKFFIALKQRFPQITWVEIQPKRGYAQNELTQFRYDVILHLGAEVQETAVPWLNWQLDQLSLTQIEHQLRQEQPELLGIRRVPNQRVQQALQIWQWVEKAPDVETVSQLRQLLAQQSTNGINPEEFWELGEQLGYSVHLSWWESSQDGCFDVVFCRHNSTSLERLKMIEVATTNVTKSWGDYTNNPLQGKLVQKLVPQVREFVQQKLPNYMVPQAFVLLNALPLTPNGKIDRRALPAPDTANRNLTSGFVSARNAIEAQLAQVWSEVLGISSISVKDNFFEIGGHSLLATQVIYRLRDIFSVELSLQNFLEYPTIASLSQIIEVLVRVQNGQPSNRENQEDYEEGEL